MWPRKDLNEEKELITEESERDNAPPYDDDLARAITLPLDIILEVRTDTVQGIDRALSYIHNPSQVPQETKASANSPVELPNSPTMTGYSESTLAFAALGLKYKRGMLLIMDHTNDHDTKEAILKDVNTAYGKWNEFYQKHLTKKDEDQEISKNSSYDESYSEPKSEQEMDVEVEEKNKEKKKEEVNIEKELAKGVKELELAFARTLFKNLHAKFHYIDFAHAHKQVTMASDIGIWLDDQFQPLTHSRINRPKPKEKEVKDQKHSPKPSKTTAKKFEKIGSEDTTFIKIGSGLYTKYLEEKTWNKKWMASTLKFAGFDSHAKDTWIQNLFSDPKVIEKLKTKGVPATSSSRWFFTPSNARKHEIKIDTGEYKQDFSAIAMGTVTAFDTTQKPVSKFFNEHEPSLQEEIAIDELTEIFDNENVNRKDRIAQYKTLYGNLAEETFYFNYQTLLSPIAGESNLSRIHKDNNENFVKMTKQAMDQLQTEYNKKKTDNIIFLHTNSAVNKLSAIAKEFSEDGAHREEKIQSTLRLLGRLNAQEEKHPINILVTLLSNKDASLDYEHKGVLKNALMAIHNLPDLSAELKNEIILRTRATYTLRRLLDANDTQYVNLPTYQRNIMIAALELLCQGKQALNLVGCKSARDRTAIVLSAVKTMMLVPRAMGNWHILNQGIMDSLEKGHHARAMRYHCEMVKVSDVHSNLNATLAKETQNKNKQRKAFSKTISDDDSNWKKKLFKIGLKLLAAGGIAAALVLFPPLGLAIVSKGIAGMIAAGGIGLGISFGVPAVLTKIRHAIKNSALWQTIKQNKWKIAGVIGAVALTAASFGVGSIPASIAFLAAVGAGYVGSKIGLKVEHKLSPGADPKTEDAVHNNPGEEKYAPSRESSYNNVPALTNIVKSSATASMSTSSSAPSSSSSSTSSTVSPTSTSSSEASSPSTPEVMPTNNKNRSFGN